MLFAFWVVLSGLLDAFHLTWGVVSATVVAALTHGLQFPDNTRSARGPVHLAMAPWPRLAAYGGWLLREVVIANWNVLKTVLDPRLPIDPAMIRFRSHLTSGLGRTILANSITLTPGTITVDVRPDGEFVVHALVGGEPVVNDLTRMQRHIAAALPGIETSVA
jgi:multicomponent Na+:H+ antiporter subunit E